MVLIRLHLPWFGSPVKCSIKSKCDDYHAYVQNFLKNLLGYLYGARKCYDFYYNDEQILMNEQWNRIIKNCSVIDIQVKVLDDLGPNEPESDVDDDDDSKNTNEDNEKYFVQDTTQDTTHAFESNSRGILFIDLFVWMHVAKPRRDEMHGCFQDDRARGRTMVRRCQRTAKFRGDSRLRRVARL